jgi:isocitrate lyase
MYLAGSAPRQHLHHLNQDQILPVCQLLSSASRRQGLIIDYPSNTVPDKVAQLFTAQLFHDRKQRWTRMQALAKGQSELDSLGESIDYLRPIVADADTGHGGEFFFTRASGVHCC